MNLLLDTHAYLWFLANNNELSSAASKAICDGETYKHVSLASAWEIALKLKLGKLTFPLPLRETFERGCSANGFEILDIQLEHIERTLDLPMHTRDPFDRLLVAQCLEEGLTFVSRDAQLDVYGINRIW